MKCICRTPCQVRVDGRIRTFGLGEVHNFTKCPMHFEPLEGEKAKPVDFASAGETELSEAEFKLVDLRKYLATTFKKRTTSTDKDKLIGILLDCRYRALTIDPNKVI